MVTFRGPSSEFGHACANSDANIQSVQDYLHISKVSTAVSLFSCMIL